MLALIIIIIVAVDLIVDLALLRWWIKRLRREAVERLREITEGERVYNVEDCNFLGRESRGYRQWRGNGLLALTDRGLRFRQLMPRTDVFIPLGSITGLSMPRSFLGKSGLKGLLRVDFRDEEGKDDACAWLLPSPAWWASALEALLAGGEPPEAPWEGETGERGALPA